MYEAPSENETVAIMISLSVVRRLRTAAAARDTTVPRLVRDLLEMTARDGLVTAILDDNKAGSNKCDKAKLRA
jgi:hypothetical protein